MERLAVESVLPLVVVLAVAVYFLPTLVALRRGHHQAGAVFVINLLLGWTLLGWAVALAIAASAVKGPPSGPRPR